MPQPPMRRPPTSLKRSEERVQQSLSLPSLSTLPSSLINSVPGLLRAAMVCVDYADLLAITLPYNRHHFSEVLIVTSHNDPETIRVARENKCHIFKTDDFYKDGASFNKWRALEHALNYFGRENWITLLDADILWPKALDIRIEYDGVTIGKWPGDFKVRPGQLLSPIRRMFDPLPIPMKASKIPPEDMWRHFTVHRNTGEWAGYTQIFHCKDPCLPPPPWHDISWKHAGGADSFFQALWAKENKIRPPSGEFFEVLHLGSAGENWLGRASTYTDGTIPAGSEEKRIALNEMWRTRRSYRGSSRQYEQEKIEITKEEGLIE